VRKAKTEEILKKIAEKKKEIRRRSSEGIS